MVTSVDLSKPKYSIQTEEIPLIVASRIQQQLKVEIINYKQNMVLIKVNRVIRHLKMGNLKLGTEIKSGDSKRVTIQSQVSQRGPWPDT